MASKIKVDNINKVSDDSNIIKKCGTTITLGASGDSIALATGASQTGFGRTGTVDWNTTKKTTDFTATNGAGFFVDTGGGVVTATLPASPSAGNIVAIKDYDGNFGTNKCTIARNGSNIRGAASDFSLEKNNAGAVFIYVDATEGWQVFVDGSDADAQPTYISATGGTITTSGDYKIHTFTGPGCFSITQAASCSTDNRVDYLVVAGGGGGGGTNCTAAGGGGAGGLRFYANTPTNPQAANPSNPINNFPSGTSITVNAETYPITVGGGGAGGPNTTGTTLGANGSVSTFSTVTSAGGGGGHGYKSGQPLIGNPGGSGGGGSYGGAGGNGNQPPVSPAQGTNGGAGDCSPQRGGGGGGAIVAGTTAAPGATGDGGAGAGFTGFGASNGQCSSCKQYFSGGGGGGSDGPAPAGGTGGLGGGANGGKAATGGNGTANTGGGGGGSQSSPPSQRTGGTGGSGIVVIRYKFQ